MVLSLHAGDWTTSERGRLPSVTDRFGSECLYPDAEGAEAWHCRWDRGVERSLTFGRDVRDRRFQVLGLSECRIFGHTGPQAGQAHLRGQAPCLFVRGEEEGRERASDLEITVYARAGYSGFTVEHGGMQTACRPGEPTGDGWMGFKVVSLAAGNGGRETRILVDRTGGRDGGDWVELERRHARGNGGVDDAVFLRLDPGGEQWLRGFSVRRIRPDGAGEAPVPVRVPVASGSLARSGMAGSGSTGTFGW